ncbi:MAG: thermonuclease family protein, partial [Acidimicrobiales bacterium]
MAHFTWISVFLVLVLLVAASSGAGGAIIMLGLAGLVVGVIALAKGSVRWLGVTSRRAGVAIVGASTAALIIGAALAPPTKLAEGTSDDVIATTPSRSPAPTTATPTPTVTRSAEPVEPTQPDGVPAGAQSARVVEIVDGDTLVLAALATGSVLATTEPVRVRLLEIDAPGRGAPFADESSRLLASIAAPGWTVWVLRDQDPVDRYGRELLYVWTDDGAFVNREMVAAGLATALLYEPNDLYIDEMRSSEQEARSGELGLWEEPDPLPPENPEPQGPAEPPDPDDEPRGDGCDPAYPGVCIPPYPPDLDCAHV